MRILRTSGCDKSSRACLLEGRSSDDCRRIVVLERRSHHYFDLEFSFGIAAYSKFARPSNASCSIQICCLREVVSFSKSGESLSRSAANSIKIHVHNAVRDGLKTQKQL
jgi:hypothetical protein